jgi:hypothetical protein
MKLPPVIMFCAAEMLKCCKEIREMYTVGGMHGILCYSAGPDGGLGIPCSLSSGFLPHTTYL